jgi:hypothetical protein
MSYIHFEQETTMSNGHAKEIEGKLNEFRKLLAALAAPADYEELLKNFHRPSWTTPAEFAFAGAILDHMSANVRGLTQLRGQLLKGAKEVQATG